VTEQAQAGPRGELARAARGSVFTFVGSAASSFLGFAFSIVLARTLGAHDAGVVLQAVAIYTIALAITRLGLDTTAVWLLPRLMSAERQLVRQAVVALLVPSFVAPLLVVLAWLVIRALFLNGGTAVADAITVVAWFLPAGVVMTVALAATRAFGGVLPFNAIGNIAVPGLRPLLIGVVAAVGGGTAAAAFGWSVPWLVGAVLALLVLVAQVRRATREVGGSWRPGSDVRHRIRTYAVPRVIGSGLDQSITWLDVVLVGTLVGSSAAGVYGTVSRFVSAGAIVATALRIVVAPRFSALLSQGRRADVEELYTVTARWILLLGSPVFIMLAVFAPTVLHWLGHGFASGRTSLVVLCAGSLVVLAAGNVQALLLMSGRSAASAVNKGIVLAFNVAGNLLFVPHYGINAAATVWALSMALDTSLAAWQVHRGIGVSVAVREIGYVLVMVTRGVGLPSGCVVWFLGQGNISLLLAILVSGLALLGYCYVDRHRLHMEELRALRGRPGGRKR
jgi:O-antigen/teichoic acid export membrane protein